MKKSEKTMSGDLLGYLEKRSALVTPDERLSIYCMLIQRFFSASSVSVIGYVKNEIKRRITTLNPIVDVLFEQVVDIEFIVGVLSSAASVISQTIEKHNIVDSWIAKALLALVRATATLNRHDFSKLGSRNTVFSSTYEKDGIDWCEFGILQIQTRRSSSLTNLLQKRLVVYDVSLYFFKASDNKPKDIAV